MPGHCIIHNRSLRAVNDNRGYDWNNIATNKNWYEIYIHSYFKVCSTLKKETLFLNYDLFSFLFLLKLQNDETHCSVIFRITN